MACRYRFGGWCLDASTRELKQGQAQVVLPPRMFDCLLWLIEHRDRAVGRDELIAAVWGTAHANDNVLAQVVARLRRVIDADGADSAIRTIPRFGYRWVAATTATAAGTGPTSRAARDEPAGRRPTARRWALAGVALATIAGVVVFVAVGMRTAPPRTDAALRPAVVLPVERTAAAGEDWMRLGLMALIGDRLREAGQPVVPSESVVAVVGDADRPDAGRIAAALAGPTAAPLLIVSRVDAVGSGWRVSLQTVGEPALRGVGDGADLLAAARLASDDLAGRLGHAPPAAHAAVPGEPGLTRLLLAVEAATLAGEIETARRLLDGAEDDQRQTPELRYRSAWTDFVAGRLDQAQAGFTALLADLPADAPVLRARVFNGLANVQYEREDIAGLAASAGQALALLQGREAPAELGRALMGQAVAAHRQGRFEQARQGFFQARLALESAGDLLGAARANLATGIVDTRQGRLLTALPLLHDAALRLTALHSVHDELLAHVHIAHAQLLLLEPAAALGQAEPIARLSARVRSPRARALADLTRAEVLLANGRLDAAGELLRGRCAGGCGEGADRLPLTLARRTIGLGDEAAILHDLETALAAVPAGEAGRDAGRAWLTLLRATGKDDRHQRARAGLRAWAGEGAAAPPQVRLYARLGEAEQQAADGRPAREAFEAAWTEALGAEVPGDLLWVSRAYVDWLIGQGDLAGASRVAGRLAGWAGRDFDSAVLQLRLRHALGYPAAWRSALGQAQALAGQRPIPPELTAEPVPRAAGPAPSEPLALQAGR